MKEVRTRFAPSPTGPLHIGGARSALFSYLYAKNHGGKFIVRIEDTDLERSSRESEKNILDSLRWLGIHWDEGIDVGGPHEPYRQTERLHTYREACDRLLAAGRAYPCYCSEEELEAEREAALAAGLMPRYSGKCRNLTPEQKAAYEAEGRKAVVRFRVPDGEIIRVDDMVRGEVEFESDGIGDYIIVKSDGIPTYNFAVVIDDHLMEITHVIRGEEHLSNTPRQLLIYDALGYEKPRFAHVSLILGKDRSKMSKRHGSTSVVQYQSQGYLPEALVNFLALLGWSPEGEEEIFTMDQLIEQFSLDRVAKSPAVFDLDKLNWLNGTYIRNTGLDRLVELAEPILAEKGYLRAGADRDKVRLIVEAVREKVSYMSEILNFAPIFFGQGVEFENDEAKAVMGEEQVPKVLGVFARLVEEADELTVDSVKEILKAVGKESGYKGRAVFMTIRVALTGQQHGPEMTHVIAVLGKEGVRARLASALAQSGLELA